ncbi:MAG: amidase [Gammaproteobacteria bacterium]|nr:amidase [Gammaproteobacteria bacterium]
MFKEYADYDATGLAALVAGRQVTPDELLQAALARAEAVNPKLNAIITPMTDIARARAAQPLTGPFAGVPFLVKDFFQEYAGVPCYYGCAALKRAGHTPREHAEIVRRWLDAGLVIFGRTNTPEFAAKGITEPEAFGPSRNPWHPDHSTGGSSGGSAAAVAAAIVPMAGANDGGGSIRIPAAYCGLFGLKPGRGRTPWGPRLGESIHGAAMNHVLTRSVRDSAALLDASHGPEDISWCRIEPPQRPYREELQRDPLPLRIGFSTRSPIGTEVHPQAVTAVENAARLLQSLGHRVEPAEPKLDGAQLAQDFLNVWFAHLAASVAEVRALTGCGGSAFELDTRAMAAIGRALRADRYVGACLRWNDYLRALARFQQDYDLYLTPTVAAPAPRIGEVATPRWQQAVLKLVLALRAAPLLAAAGVVEQMAHDNLKWAPFTQLANLTGVPAMSVPLHWVRCCAADTPRPAASNARPGTVGSEPVGAKGPQAADDGGQDYLLPLGVQFVGRHGGEGLLLQLAAQIERAQPWAQRRPPL